MSPNSRDAFRVALIVEPIAFPEFPSADRHADSTCGINECQRRVLNITA